MHSHTHTHTNIHMYLSMPVLPYPSLASVIVERAVRICRRVAATNNEGKLTVVKWAI